MAKAPTKRQSANIFISNFSKSYEKKLGKKMVFSRYAIVWSVIDLFEDYGYEEINSVAEYFFKINRSRYDIESFLANFHKLLDGMNELDRRNEERKKLLAETKRLVEEFEQHRS